MTELMDDTDIDTLVRRLDASGKGAVVQLDSALADYPNDARLHFLKGSILASMGRPMEAHTALSRSVALDPEFHLARFQLGLFLLTSGEVENALSVWEGLNALPNNHYLKLFVIGLRHLVEDEFQEAHDVLKAGQDENNENAPLNADIEKIIQKISPLLDVDASDATPSTMASHRSDMSLTSVLLQQSGSKPH